MIRVNCFESCAGKHIADIENIVFKDKEYKTLSKTFDLNRLEFQINVDFLEKLKTLRENYNNIKSKLNQYKERHILLNNITLNKRRLNSGINKIGKIDLSILSQFNEKLNNINFKLYNIKKNIDNLKNNEAKKINNLTNEFSNTIKSNTFRYFKIGFINEWIKYNNDCYVDLPVKNKNIILTSLESSYENEYLLKDITSIYYIKNSDFWRVYLKGIDYKTANKKLKLWYLSIEKENNAN